MMTPSDSDRIRGALAREVRAALERPWSRRDPAIRRVELPVADLDPLEWLAAQQDEIKGYWSDRSAELEMAAFGEAEVLKNRDEANHAEMFASVRERLPLTERDIRYYGGFRFGPWHRSDKSWRVFGGYRFILPRFELVRRGTDRRLACIITRQDRETNERGGILDAIEDMALPRAATCKALPPPLRRQDMPEQGEWTDGVARVLQGIARGDLQKAVLARRTCFEFAQPLDGFHLLRRLKEATGGCYHFCGSHEGRVAFVGASPERLYRRSGRLIFSEAVAGTRPRGTTPQEDAALAAELMGSAKDLKEHRLVIDGIREALRPLCETLRSEPDVHLLKLNSLQHLVCRFEGRLREGVGDAQVMEQLHPTSAVGGYPRDPALKLLGELETFDRGYYASPVGWVSGDEAEFAVAIRCGVVAGPRLCLFSGAGIVQGSDARTEWQEVESKIGAFLNVLTTP
jgi:menaquinone-specific isochorismate synthase